MTARITRRRFVVDAGVAGLGLVAGCGTPAFRAPWSPPPTKLPRIGFLDAEQADSPNAVPRLQSFRDALKTAGYSEGENLLIEWRFADYRREQLPALAAELVHLPVDLIVASTPPAILAARAATSTIPIVMIFGENPVASGLVQTLARPGGNVTGLAAFSTELVGKRLELLKEAAPWIARLAVFYDLSPVHPAMLQELERVAPRLGVAIHVFEARAPADMAATFRMASAEAVDSLIVLPGDSTSANMNQVLQFALDSHLPAIYPFSVWVRSGGLMSYSQNTIETHQRVAHYIDRILKGADPADLPVEQPMTFDLIVNLKTAQALGLTFPNEILLQVTEVIR